MPRALLLAGLSVLATLVGRLAAADGVHAVHFAAGLGATAAAGWIVARRRRGEPPLPRAVAALGVSLVLALSLGRGAAGATADRMAQLDWPAGEVRAGWVRGRLAAEPRSDAAGWRGLIAVDQSTLGLRRGARLSLRAGGATAPARGTLVEAFVEIERPLATHTPGGFDAARWLAAQRALAWGRVRGTSLRVLGPPPPGLGATLDAWRGRLTTALTDRLPGDGGGLLRGLLLGERDAVSPEAVEDFRRAGVLHLLALSGQHVALVAALLVGAARSLRLGTGAGAACVAGGIWTYAFLTGASASVVRASLAASVALAGHAACRPVPGWQALAWSAALGPLAEPRLVADVGFQLSCLASAGLVLAARWDAARRFADPLWAAPPGAGERGARGWLARWAARPLAFATGLLVATTAAQLAVLPLLAMHFGVVSAVGLASNLLLVPASTALLAAGLPLLFADSVVPLPASLWRPLGLGAAAVLELGRRFAALPGGDLACTLSPPLGGGALAALAAAVSCGVLAGRSARHGGTLTGATLAATGLWLGLTAAAFVPRPAPPTARLEYWLLDVGQGDAQVLEFADGYTLVVDAGEGGPGPPGSFDAGERVVAPFLRARGHARVDCVVLTHEDRDHAGGFGALSRALRVDELASGEATLATLAARGALEGFRGRRRAVRAGDVLCAGAGWSVRVLWPLAGDRGEVANNRSVVLWVEVGEERLLLTGDADSTAENRWVAALASTVSLLKLGHHGSRSSTGHTLLAAARPRRAVCSAGRANRFRHPHAETLARLAAGGFPLERTDRQGTLRLPFGGAPPVVTAPARRTPEA